MVKIWGSSWNLVGMFDGSEGFWRDNIHGVWVTIPVLFFILIWQPLRDFIAGWRSRSVSVATNQETSGSGIRNPQTRISEIVSNVDLSNLINELDGTCNADEKWENVIDKRNNLISYNAKCCKPKDGPLKYISVTVFENCSTERLRDFYMDNDYRKQWDNVVIDHEQLQVDETNGTEIGRTIKKFPFLTPREYVLAWRVWEGKDKSFYCLTKECEHALAPRQKKYVRVGVFRSGWRIRRIPGRNACEIKLVHQEDAGMNVEMTKLAFSKRIWNYVCKMDDALRNYSPISSPQSSSVMTAVMFLQKVPPELDTTTETARRVPPESSLQVSKQLSKWPSKQFLGSVAALSVMYNSLGSPSQLSGWKASGGDPCGGDWKGITCSGSSVTQIKLSGLGLSGSMGYQLSSLTSVTYFDLSKNNLKGDIPYQLPPNANHIDLGGNSLTGGVPYSISQMSDLKYLNLGHNKITGQLSDMFGQLHKLAFLDLSFNTLSGNLPQSFASLSSLKELHLGNNQFTGSINVLAKLPLDSLNIENNKFTGSVPKSLRDIDELETGGNSWSGSGSENDHHGSKHTAFGQSRISGVAIAGIVMGVLLALLVIILLISRKKPSYASTHYLDEEKLSQRQFSPLVSRELSNDLPHGSHSDFKDFSYSSKAIPAPELQSLESSSSINVKGLQSSPSIGLKPPPSIKSFNDTDFGSRINVKRSTSIRTVIYSLADLQSATGNFATGRLLGEGSLGRVYRAKYSDGKVLAVKKIDSSLLQSMESDDITEMISNISKLHHPNIAELVGYCSEQGHNLLVYEYFRNGSLHEFLHLTDDYGKPLTWNTRIRIALGTARAVEYLHEICSPSTVHKDIKSSNILLDTELNPRLSDCGLGNFYQRTSQNLGAGYNAPECTKPSAYTLKSDVYSFGVVMLELLTGRMPYDSKRPRSEQSLVRWATPQLHDIDALAKMVDPALHGLYPPKSLSRFADVIALCVQSEPEFRPPMSEVVQALVRLVQRSSMNKRGDDSRLSSASRRSDSSDVPDYY